MNAILDVYRYAPSFSMVAKFTRCALGRLWSLYAPSYFTTAQPKKSEFGIWVKLWDTGVDLQPQKQQVSGPVKRKRSSPIPVSVEENKVLPMLESEINAILRSYALTPKRYQRAHHLLGKLRNANKETNSPETAKKIQIFTHKLGSYTKH